MNQGVQGRETDIIQLDETEIVKLDLLDHQGVDWSRVQRTAYLLHQHLRYEYPGPIYNLNHRLMIVPPEHYGDQRLIIHRLEVSAAHETIREQDAFGNTLLTLKVPHVEQAIDFEAWIVVERRANNIPAVLPAACLLDPRYLDPSPLTRPDEALRQAAMTLAADGLQGLALAERLTTWVYETLSYTHGATDIHTPAAKALAHKKGVCQDYAHVLIALCRLCGLPARYVSGHLLGEGGTHAWVEVLSPAEGALGEAIAWPFDPTHGRRAGLSYLTIAVGRDYQDVAPTSGTFRAAYSGQLSSRKRVGLTALEYKSEETEPVE